MLKQSLTINRAALELVDRIEANLRGRVLVDAARAAGELVETDARPRITAPGYKGDKAGLKPLRDSLTTVVRDYSNVVVAIVGTAWPEGAHGHLVEFGHIGKKPDGTTYHVPPHPWLRPAIESTRASQEATILQQLRAATTSQLLLAGT